MSFHNEGHAAFNNGTGSLSSPYPDWERRSQWVKGWYDAQHDVLFAPVAKAPKVAAGYFL